MTELPAKHRPRLTSSLAVLLVFVACSDRGASEDKQSPSPPAKAIDAAITYSPSTFCEEVFPSAAVRAVVDHEIQAATKATAGPNSAIMQCGYVAASDPSRTITLRVDCTRATSAAEQRKFLSAMAAESDDYREVEIGGGGAKLYNQRFNSRFLAYGHERLPCSVTLETANALEDRLDRLAELVQKRLSSGNRPRLEKAP